MGEVELVSMMVRRVVNLIGVSISPIITVKLPCEGMRCGGRGGREGGRCKERVVRLVSYVLATPHTTEDREDNSTTTTLNEVRVDPLGLRG